MIGCCPLPRPWKTDCVRYNWKKTVYLQMSTNVLEMLLAKFWISMIS